MPQLDKISFATQYFWLTLFFFGLYFLTINFFVILVFKNLKLRNMIYRIWYFFFYKFDYEEYEKKNSLLLSTCFSSVYYCLYINFLISLKISYFFNNLNTLSNKNLFLNYLSTTIHSNIFNKVLIKNYAGTSTLINLNNISVDEI